LFEEEEKSYGGFATERERRRGKEEASETEEKV